MRVIIAAAGTGGHINPGLAIARKIKREDEKSEVLFIGTDRGLEQDLVPREGFPLKTIDAYGLSKEISIANLKKIIKTLKGVSQAKKIIKEFKPDVVIGTGGYICGAVIIAANKLKIPTMLHESNAFPGKAVKILAKKTNVIMVSFEVAMKRIPNAKKIVLTGTPIREIKQKITDSDKIKEIEKYSLNPAKPTVLVFGGSQGAKKINEAIVDLATKKLNKKYQILLVAGQKQYEDVKNNLKEKGLDIEKLAGIKVVPYIYEMVEAMSAADIMVCRSGATTITEVAMIGKPAIFVPLPNVSHNHQQYNAEVLSDINAARILKNDTLSAEEINQTIEEILDKNTLSVMGENAKKIAINDTQERIFKEIEMLVK